MNFIINMNSSNTCFLVNINNHFQKNSFNFRNNGVNYTMKQLNNAITTNNNNEKSVYSFKLM